MFCIKVPPTFSKQPSRHCCTWKTVGGGGGIDGGISIDFSPLRDCASLIKIITLISNPTLKCIFATDLILDFLKDFNCFSLDKFS